MKYIIETTFVKRGMFKDADDNIVKGIQPILDAGANKGYKLHTLTETSNAKDKGFSYMIVWEVG